MIEPDGRLLICATTFADRGIAEEVTARLVDEGLVVCGQVGADLVSFFRWEGRVCREAEVAVRLKIRDDRIDRALDRLRELHPYEVPQILAWSIDRVDLEYGKWAWEDGS